MKQFKISGLTFLLAVLSLSDICLGCEVVKIPMCKRMPYNMTKMPNLLHHSTQENAILAIEQFEELVDQNCSDVLLFFLCAMYAPICTFDFQTDAIPPCKGVCEQARAGCEPLMNEYNVSWPECLDCKDLPLYDRGVCVSPEAIVSTLPEENKKDQPTSGNRDSKGRDKANEIHRGRKKGCRCGKRARPTRALYRKSGFDFALRGKPIYSLRTGENAITRIQVISVLASGKVAIQTGTRVELWSNFTCICPEMVLNKDYLILGFEDQKEDKLQYRQNSIAVPWRDKWEIRVKNWAKRSRRGKGKKRRRKDRKRQRNKNNPGQDRKKPRRNKNTDGQSTGTRSSRNRNRKNRRRDGKSRNRNREKISGVGSA